MKVQKFITLVLMLLVPILPEPTPRVFRVVSSNDVRVRRQPNLNGQIIGMLQSQTRVTVLGRTEQKVLISNSLDYWYQIRFQHMDGWMFGAFLTNYSVDPFYSSGGRSIQANCTLFPDNILPPALPGGYLSDFESFQFLRDHSFRFYAIGLGSADQKGTWHIETGKITALIDWDGGKSECLSNAMEATAGGMGPGGKEKLEMELQRCETAFAGKATTVKIQFALQNQSIILKPHAENVFGYAANENGDNNLGCLHPL